jgi:hypothetical protein
MLDEKAAKAQSGILDVMRKFIPGYSDYLDEESTRNNDRQIREFLAKRLDEAIAALDKAKVSLINGGQMMMLPQLESPKNRIGRLRDKIRFANYGYSAMFADKTINKAKLEEIVGYDKSLYDEVDNIHSSCEDLLDASSSPEEVKEILSELESTLNLLNKAVSARDDMMKE